jgi:2-oxoglutarate/2-oxoacid ferredoxin oxidoreductase subunit beta
MATVQDFRTVKPEWCPACGDFAVLAGLINAVVELGLEPQNVACVTGIGCSGKLSQYIGGYGLHCLHGRSIPTAVGVKMANRDLTVIAAGGDGDGYGLGLSHFLHAVRRNIDITYIVMDNHIYGLTTGQASPTSDPGMKTKTSPTGVIEWPIRPLELAIVNGGSFVAQAFSGNRKQMEGIMRAAIQHKGFSLINVFSPCVTFNRINTYDWYKDVLRNVEEEEGYDPTDREKALAVATDYAREPVGILYHDPKLRASYEDSLSGFSKTGLVRHDLRLSDEYLEKLTAEYA